MITTTPIVGDIIYWYSRHPSVQDRQHMFVTVVIGLVPDDKHGQACYCRITDVLNAEYASGVKVGQVVILTASDYLYCKVAGHNNQTKSNNSFYGSLQEILNASQNI